MQSVETNKDDVHRLAFVWSEIENIHGYKIIEYLGAGTYGSVVKALHIATQTYYAIKLVSNCFSDSYGTR